MGDGADDCLDRILMKLERDEFGEDRMLMELEMDEFDEDLGENEYPYSAPRKKKPKGPGPCPTCGGETTEKTGQYGVFYGCTKFPKCKGSRGN